ncbi:hypothetical protein AVEN_74895-1 [Araneus ventricosus]|uniref:Uncharacterized protein n=1 Tax=Araneus ventricosus TaxID=182803 RepID=A0A4Y2SMY5_ARAVE|nr:hypothetical protein AVEN_74895-1 [Araneus ventricosus]
MCLFTSMPLLALDKLDQVDQSPCQQAHPIYQVSSFSSGHLKGHAFKTAIDSDEDQRTSLQDFQSRLQNTSRDSRAIDSDKE